jgi:hypothetical protein
MTDDNDKRDPKVKDVLRRGTKPLSDVVDPVTAAELERWFGLPSFQQVAEEPDKFAAEQDENQAVRERASSHVKPALVAAIELRNQAPEAKFVATIEPVTADLALFDTAMLEHGLAIGEARELEIPGEVHAALEENTPQALLRDLHRIESDFEKYLEIIDYGAAQRLDIVDAVRTAMATTWKLPPLDRLPAAATQRLIDEFRSVRGRRWDEVFGKVGAS